MLTFVWRLLLVVLCTCPVVGCSSYRTVTVHIVDAETGEPIPNALVRTYRAEGWPWYEQQELVKTYRAPRGVARVRAIRGPVGDVTLVPEAAGYLGYWASDANADGTPTSEGRDQ